MWDALYPYLAALLPTIGVCFLFYFVVKYIVEGDRRERLAQAKWQAEHKTRHKSHDESHNSVSDRQEGPVDASGPSVGESTDSSRNG